MLVGERKSEQHVFTYDDERRLKSYSKRIKNAVKDEFFERLKPNI